MDRYSLDGLPHLANAQGDLWPQYDVSYQPRWILIRADGSIERGGGGIPGDVVADALVPA